MMAKACFLHTEDDITPLANNTPLPQDVAGAPPCKTRLAAPAQARSFCTAVCVIAALFCMLAIGAADPAYAQMEVPNLISPVPDGDATEQEEHSVYANYASRSEFARVAAPSASTESVRFAAFGQDVILSRNVTNTEDGILAWHGTDDSGTVAILIVDGSEVFGTIEAANGTYAIVPVSSDTHEVLELDASMFPPLNHPDPSVGLGVSGASGTSSIDRALISQLESAYTGWSDYDSDSIGSTVTIRVMVPYTDAVITEVGSASSLVRFIEEKANRVYEWNDLPIRIDTVPGGSVTYTEADDIKKDLANLKGATNTGLSRVHVLAERNNADLVIMLIEDNTRDHTFENPNPHDDDVSFCNDSDMLATNTNTAFGVVSHTCVVNDYATAVIGALQGAKPHNGTNSEFSYGHGHYDADVSKRTVMVPGEVDCDLRTTSATDKCAQDGRWSDPHRNFRGTQVPAGTVEKWNARVVFATAPHVASLRGDAQNYDSARPTGAITLPSTIPASGTMQIRAAFSEAIHEAFPPYITITDGGTDATTAVMTRSSGTVYTYPHLMDGETGTMQLLFSNARDLFGNPVVKNPTSGGSFAANAASAPRQPAPAAGSVISVTDSFQGSLTTLWRTGGDGSWSYTSPTESVPDQRISTNRVGATDACDDSCYLTLKKTLDTTEPLVISFDRYVDRKIDRNEGLHVEYSTDGTTWTKIASYTDRSGDDTDRWERSVIGLSIPEKSANLRLHAESNRAGEHVEVDNIRVFRPADALPDVSFTATLNDARTAIAVTMSKSSSHTFTTSDFTLSHGTVSSIVNTPNSAARSLQVSGISYDTAVTVTYAGPALDLGGGAILNTNTAAVAPPIPQPRLCGNPA